MYQDRTKRKKGFLGLIGGLIGGALSMAGSLSAASEARQLAMRQENINSYTSAVDNAFKANNSLYQTYNGENSNEDSLSEKATINSKAKCGGKFKRRKALFGELFSGANITLNQSLNNKGTSDYTDPDNFKYTSITQNNNSANINPNVSGGTNNNSKAKLGCKRNKKDFGGFTGAQWGSFGGGVFNSLGSFGANMISNKANNALKMSEMKIQAQNKMDNLLNSQMSATDMSKDDRQKAKDSGMNAINMATRTDIDNAKDILDKLKYTKTARLGSNINSLDRIKQQQLFACGGRKRR